MSNRANGSISIDIAFLPKSIASIAVVPDPQNGSSTVSPAFEYALIAKRGTAEIYLVGYLLNNLLVEATILVLSGMISYI